MIMPMIHLLILVLCTTVNEFNVLAYNFIGCYKDSPFTTGAQSYSGLSAPLTIGVDFLQQCSDNCLIFEIEKPTSLFAINYDPFYKAAFCYCGTFVETLAKTDPGHCNYSCTFSGQSCGGISYLSVYSICGARKYGTSCTKTCPQNCDYSQVNTCDITTGYCLKGCSYPHSGPSCGDFSSTIAIPGATNDGWWSYLATLLVTQPITTVGPSAESTTAEICYPGLCRNGGNCSINTLENTYRCTCPRWTSGRNCESFYLTEVLYSNGSRAVAAAAAQPITKNHIVISTFVVTGLIVCSILLCVGVAIRNSAASNEVFEEYPVDETAHPTVQTTQKVSHRLSQVTGVSGLKQDTQHHTGGQMKRDVHEVNGRLMPTAHSFAGDDSFQTLQSTTVPGNFPSRAELFEKRHQRHITGPDKGYMLRPKYGHMLTDRNEFAPRVNPSLTSIDFDSPDPLGIIRMHRSNDLSSSKGKQRSRKNISISRSRKSDHRMSSLEEIQAKRVANARFKSRVSVVQDALRFIPGHTHEHAETDNQGTVHLEAVPEEVKNVAEDGNKLLVMELQPNVPTALVHFPTLLVNAEQLRENEQSIGTGQEIGDSVMVTGDKAQAVPLLNMPPGNLASAPMINPLGGSVASAPGILVESPMTFVIPIPNPLIGNTGIVSPPKQVAGVASPPNQSSDTASPPKQSSGIASPPKLFLSIASPSKPGSGAASPPKLISDISSPPKVYSGIANSPELTSEIANQPKITSGTAIPHKLTTGIASPPTENAFIDSVPITISANANPTIANSVIPIPPIRSSAIGNLGKEGATMMTSHDSINPQSVQSPVLSLQGLGMPVTLLGVQMQNTTSADANIGVIARMTTKIPQTTHVLTEVSSQHDIIIHVDEVVSNSDMNFYKGDKIINTSETEPSFMTGEQVLESRGRGSLFNNLSTMVEQKSSTGIAINVYDDEEG